MAYIVIDDNTPKDRPAFTNTPSVWSLENDLGLSGCKDYLFFAALGYRWSKEYPEPLIDLRGVCPADLPEDVVYELQDEDFVGWITLEELLSLMERMGLHRASFSKSVTILLNVLQAISTTVGKDRVLLQYYFLT